MAPAGSCRALVQAMQRIPATPPPPLPLPLQAKVPLSQVSVDTAVELARSPAIAHQVTAATAMRGMVASRSSVVLDAGGVQALLHLLATSRWKEVHHAAATAVAELAAANRGVREMVVQSGGCATLVRLLCDRHQRTQQAAAAAVWSLSVGGRPARCTLAAAGAAGPLVKLLRNNESARLAATSALYNLAHEPAAAAAIAAADGIPALVHVLALKKKKAPDKAGLRQAQAAAAGVLWLLADCQPESRAAINSAGGVQALVGLLRAAVHAPFDGGASFQAAGCLHCLAQDSSLAAAVGTAGAAGPLAQLLRSGSDDAKEQAAGALWCMARHSEGGANAVADAGAAHPLVCALGSASRAVQHQAAGCLRSLLRGSGANGGGLLARRVAVLAAKPRAALLRLMETSPGSDAAVEARGVLAELDASSAEPSDEAGSDQGSRRTCRACSAHVTAADVWALAPCGHCGMCGACAAKLCESKAGCPVCGGQASCQLSKCGACGM